LFFFVAPLVYQFKGGIHQQIYVNPRINVFINIQFTTHFDAKSIEIDD